MIANLADAILSHINNYKTQMFTSLPAKVTAYNSKEQTCSAKPVMNEAYKDGDTSEFPEIDHIPVIFVGSGGGSLTFPVKVGDEVLLTFSSRSFDTWWVTGDTQELSSTQRYNDLNDAVAIIGLTSKGNSVEASEEDVELKFKENTVRLKDNGSVEIDTKTTFSVTNQTDELISILSEVVDECSKILTNTLSGPTPPNNITKFSELKIRLDTFKK